MSVTVDGNKLVIECEYWPDWQKEFVVVKGKVKMREVYRKHLDSGDAFGTVVKYEVIPRSKYVVIETYSSFAAETPFQIPRYTEYRVRWVWNGKEWKSVKAWKETSVF
jgi:hypothetical protein